jgi:hypothetical protein
MYDLTLGRAIALYTIICVIYTLYEIMMIYIEAEYILKHNKPIIDGICYCDNGWFHWLGRIYGKLRPQTVNLDRASYTYLIWEAEPLMCFYSGVAGKQCELLVPTLSYFVGAFNGFICYCMGSFGFVCYYCITRLRRAFGINVLECHRDTTTVPAFDKRACNKKIETSFDYYSSMKYTLAKSNPHSELDRKRRIATACAADLCFTLATKTGKNYIYDICGDPSKHKAFMGKTKRFAKIKCVMPNDAIKGSVVPNGGTLSWVKAGDEIKHYDSVSMMVDSDYYYTADELGRMAGGTLLVVTQDFDTKINNRPVTKGDHGVTMTVDDDVTYTHGYHNWGDFGHIVTKNDGFYRYNTLLRKGGFRYVLIRPDGGTIREDSPTILKDIAVRRYHASAFTCSDGVYKLYVDGKVGEALPNDILESMASNIADGDIDKSMAYAAILINSATRNGTVKDWNSYTLFDAACDYHLRHSLWRRKIHNALGTLGTNILLRSLKPLRLFMGTHVVFTGELSAPKCGSVTLSTPRSFSEKARDDATPPSRTSSDSVSGDGRGPGPDERASVNSKPCNHGNERTTRESDSGLPVHNGTDSVSQRIVHLGGPEMFPNVQHDKKSDPSKSSTKSRKGRDGSGPPEAAKPRSDRQGTSKTAGGLPEQNKAVALEIRKRASSHELTSERTLHESGRSAERTEKRESRRSRSASATARRPVDP